MQYQILKEPMSMLEIQLNKEEEITAEAGALVYIKGPRRSNPLGSSAILLKS
jgi:uncharacterized protein (AIM24 family)